MADNLTILSMADTQSGDSRPVGAQGRSEDGSVPPALDQIPVHRFNPSPDCRLVVYDEPHSLGADRFRMLRLRLYEQRKVGKLKTVSITSPLPQDGKSTVALNLATLLAAAVKHPVLLIEADLHHRALSESLSLEGRPGFAECLEQSVDPISLLIRIEPLGMYFLPGGSYQMNPAELLQSPGLPLLLDKMGQHFEWIILDTPPILPLTDAVLLSGQSEGTLLVVRAGQTRREHVEEALKLLLPDRFLGIVLNGAEQLNQEYDKYYGSYYYKKRASVLQS